MDRYINLLMNFNKETHRGLHSGEVQSACMTDTHWRCRHMTLLLLRSTERNEQLQIMRIIYSEGTVYSTLRRVILRTAYITFGIIGWRLAQLESFYHSQFFCELHPK